MTREFDTVAYLLKQPHAIAEGVLYTLSDEQLIRLAQGFPVGAAIQKRIEQELLKRRLAQEKSNEYGYNYWRNKIVVAAVALFGGLALYALTKLLD